MNLSVETILHYTILSGIIAIVYGYLTGKQILNSSPGNSKMQEIASAIQVGAKAYLNRQYKTIAIVGVVVLIIISYAFSILPIRVILIFLLCEIFLIKFLFFRLEVNNT